MIQIYNINPKSRLIFENPTKETVKAVSLHEMYLLMGKQPEAFYKTYSVVKGYVFSDDAFEIPKQWKKKIYKKRMGAGKDLMMTIPFAVFVLGVLTYKSQGDCNMLRRWLIGLISH